MIISTPNLLLRLFVLLIFLIQTCHCMNCSPSACGIVGNISFPFRLKNDPEECGVTKYELSCENNVTLVYLNSQKYLVKAINYDNFTIRLVDGSITNDTCSFPKYSTYAYNFSDGYPYGVGIKGDVSPYSNSDEVALPINFMSCPLNSSSLLTGDDSCASNSSSNTRAYVEVGHLDVSEVIETCRVEAIVMTSWEFEELKNVSLVEIHEALLYGFELSWFKYPCSNCSEEQLCDLNEDNTFTCFELYRGVSASYFLIFIVFLCVGLIIPAQIFIFVFTSFLVISYLAGWKWSFNKDNFDAILGSFTVYIVALFLGMVKVPLAVIFITGSFFFFAVPWEWGWFPTPPLKIYSVQGLLRLAVTLFPLKNFILFPCAVGFMIRKFRRRRLSMYDTIEDFLQSDHKLMPIRYSYSDIKKMTRGFQEKLGQGGYGMVYKGRLRSGHHVAVKLLGKLRANDQDFMNEIATIGRIHHVNVIKLIGYCAERSKRALVYDFMPNGSLDKYIFSAGKTNCLNWEMKYKIAVGVARGIEYLHRGCDIQILHFDIKPHNILLDDNFIPKISDFGLAKFCSMDKNTVTMTAARGTIGYVAPELFNRGFGGVSYKADVYSFGMLLIEMAGITKELKGNNQSSSQYFPDWIYGCLDQGKDIEFGKSNEEIEEDDDSARKIGRKMAIVALWCIQMRPEDRPSMNKVMEMLEAEIEQLRIPERPTQSSQVAIDMDQSLSTFSTDSVSLLHHDAAASTFEIIVEES